MSRSIRRFRRPRVWIGVGAALGLVALGAVLLLPTGDEPKPDEDALRVSMTEMAFEPIEMQAAPGQEVFVDNDGTIVHSMLITGLAKGVELGPGQSTSFTLPDGVTGTYPVICDIPGHKEAGMVATLVIGGPGAVSEGG